MQSGQPIVILFEALRLAWLTVKMSNEETPREGQKWVLMRPSNDQMTYRSARITYVDIRINVIAKYDH